MRLFARFLPVAFFVFSAFLVVYKFVSYAYEGTIGRYITFDDEQMY